MNLIRNAYQAIKYHITSSQDEQIERQISRMRFGLTDAERNEQLRQQRALRAFWWAIVVAVGCMYVIAKVSA